MYCENCGGFLGDQARFCVVCGSAKRGSMNVSGSNARFASPPQIEPKTTFFQMPRWVAIGLGAAFVALTVFGAGWLMLEPRLESERISNAEYRAAALKRAEKRDEERLAMERLAQHHPESENRLQYESAQRSLAKALEENFGMPGYQTSWYGQIVRVEVVGDTAIAKTRLPYPGAQASSICSAVSGIVFSNDNRGLGVTNVRVDGTRGVLINRIGIASRCK